MISATGQIWIEVFFAPQSTTFCFPAQNISADLFDLKEKYLHAGLGLFTIQGCHI